MSRSQFRSKPCPTKILRRNPYARVRSLQPFRGRHMTPAELAHRWRMRPKTFANIRSQMTAKRKTSTDTDGPAVGAKSGPLLSALCLPFLKLGHLIRYRFGDVLEAEAAALRTSTSDPGPAA